LAGNGTAIFYRAPDRQGGHRQDQERSSAEQAFKFINAKTTKSGEMERGIFHGRECCRRGSGTLIDQ
jgi:hypothetical protein